MLLHYMILAVGLAWGGIVVGSWLGWQLLRQNGRILLRLDDLEKRLNELEFGGGGESEGLAVGSDAPAFQLAGLAGERKSLAQFRGKPLLLIFFNPDCGFCREMMPKLAALLGSSPISTGESDGPPRVLILTTGNAEKNREFFAQHKVICPVLSQTDGEVAKAYRASGTPTGYLVSTDGKIASALAIGAEALLKLAEGGQGTSEGDRASRFGDRSLARSRIKRDGLKPGTPAPDFSAPRLDGKGGLALSELRGKRVLLVFSSPHCGPCNELAPQLEKFHRANSRQKDRPSLGSSAPGGGEGSSAVEVLMISKGDLTENRAKVKEHGLSFPILLQQQWEISRRYAMFATPIAYLIDETGIIIHDVAVGIDAIQELMIESTTEPDPKPRLAFQHG